MPLFDLSLNYIQRDRVESFDPLLYLMVCFVLFYSPVLTLGIKSTRKDLVCDFAIIGMGIFFLKECSWAQKLSCGIKGRMLRRKTSIVSY